MADWLNPTITSDYLSVPAEIKDRDINLATMFDSGTFSSIPTDAIRWNSANSRFEKWSGTVWNELDTEYAINVTSISTVTISELLRTNPGTDQTITSGKLILNINSGTPLDLKGGTADFVGIQLFADAAAQSTRSAVIGFTVATSQILRIQNDYTNSNIDLITNGAGVVLANGNEVLTVLGGQTIGGALTVQTNLTVQGTFTSLGIDDNASSQRLQVNDANLTLGSTFGNFTINLRDPSQTLLIYGSPAQAGAGIVLQGMFSTYLAGGTEFVFRSEPWMRWDEDLGALTVFTDIGLSKTLAFTLDRYQDATFAGSIAVGGIARFTKGADIASANDTVLLADGNYNDITGAITVNGMTDGVLNEVRKFHFDGAALLKHNTAASAGYSSLWLPNAADYTTVANDELEFVYDGTYWRLSAAITGEKLYAGDIVQIVNVEDGEVATGTTIIPFDDTIPQNTEGNEYMSLSITPKNANNILIIESIWIGAHSTSTTLMACALFKDAIVDALAATFSSKPNLVNTYSQVVLRHQVTAGSVTARTYKIRSGSGQAGTTTFNGVAAARRFGGIMASSITITEYKT